MSRSCRSPWTALLLMLLSCAAGHAQTASGTINATLSHRSGIAIMFNSDPAGVPLGNAGMSNATLNFGNVSYLTTVPPAGVTLTRTASDFTISTPFNVFVFTGGNGSKSYRLTAALQAAPGVFTWSLDGIALSAVPAVIAAADPRYGANAPHTLFLTIPTTANPGVVTNVINFTATAN